MALKAPQIFILPQDLGEQVFSIWWDQMPKKPGVYFYLATDWETNFIQSFDSKDADLPKRVDDDLLQSVVKQTGDCYALISAKAAEATGMISVSNWRTYPFFGTKRLLVIITGAPEPFPGEGMALPFVNSFVRSLFEVEQDWSRFVSTNSGV